MHTYLKMIESNSNPPSVLNSKRQRNGSISGRLRAASDLEECGLIDKSQKGMIKDLIISGDPVFDRILDDCDSGRTEELETFLQSKRKSSIDLLEGLDFEFFHGMSGENEVALEDISTAFDEDFLYDPISFSAQLDNPFGVDEDLLVGNHSIHTLNNTKQDKKVSGVPPLGNATVDLSAYAAIAAALQGVTKNKEKYGVIGSFGNNNTLKKEKEFPTLAFPLKVPALSEIQGGNYGKAKGNNNTSSANSKGNKKSHGSSQSALNLNSSAAVAAAAVVAAAQKVPPLPSSTLKNCPNHEVSKATSYNILQNPENYIGNPGYIGAYSPEQRKLRIEKFFEKRNSRIWTKKVKYDVRKNFADSRLRIKGRFVKKEDEDVIRTKELSDVSTVPEALDKSIAQVKVESNITTKTQGVQSTN